MKKKKHTMGVVLVLSGVLFIAGATFKGENKLTKIDNVSYKKNNSLAINVETTKGSGIYTTRTIPTTGSYKVNTDRSYCTIGKSTEKLKNIPMEYKDGRVYIGVTEEGTKCYVWLDIEETLADKIKEKVNSPSEGCPAYEEAPSITSIEDKKSLLCKGIDDFGDTYYYRGNVTNNWVKFGKVGNADIWWRIIRINGNGSIRLIYAGTSTTSSAPKTTGSDTQIGTSAFNSQYNNAQYVKYDNSTIKGVLDSWYNTNLKSTYGNKIDGTAGFCNDADYGSTSSIIQYFKPYDRIYGSTKTATFKCNTKDNLFTTSGNSNGNEKLTNPIGLITIDEESFAGGLGGSYNTDYYLYTVQDYWTMSPNAISSHASVFIVYSNGYLNDSAVSNAKGVRPVINLKADTKFQEGGTGTTDHPYILSGN